MKLQAETGKAAPVKDYQNLFASITDTANRLERYVLVMLPRCEVGLQVWLVQERLEEQSRQRVESGSLGSDENLRNQQ